MENKCQHLENEGTMKKVHTGVRLGQHEYDAIAKQAKKERRTFSDMLRIIIENWARGKK